MADETIVVLGGGVGGVVAANELHGRLKGKASIVLVERNPLRSLPLSYLWVMTDERKPEAITRDISGLERKGIEFVASEITRVDPAKRLVATKDGRSATTT
jgi:sulfide:quinone oxidoreductase